MDLATLGIRVDASGAIPQVEQIGAKLDGLAAKGEKARDAMGRFVKGAGGVAPVVTGIGAPVDGLVNRFGALGNAARSASSWFAALGVTLGAGAIFTKFVRATKESQDAMAQLEARVKSTGMAAGLSAKQLDEMSLALARQTTYGDEAIKGAQSLLLTFTKIRGDVFNDATLAVADLATAMGTDLKSAAIQVGKALQDPAQGLLALRRSGVSFSETQQEMIKHLFATGRHAEAQRLILQELQVEFGGAAKAARDTLGGALKALGEEFDNLFEVSRESSGGIVKFINLINKQIQALALTLGGQKAIMRAAFSTESPETMARHLKEVERQMKAIGDQWTRQGFQTETERERLNELSEEYTVLTDLLREAAEGQKALRTATEGTTTSVYEQALADERAARAKELLNAQVKAQVDLEEKIARGVRFDLPKLGIQAAGIGAGPDIGITDAAKKMQEQLTRTSREESAKRAKAEVDAWYAAAAEIEKMHENFLRGLHDAFARTFEDVFTKGVRSFEELFKRLSDLIKQAAAQLLASGLMRLLAGKKGASSGDESGSSAAGGASASLAAMGPWGMVAAAAVLLGSSLLSSAKAAREHAKALAEAAYKAAESAFKAAQSFVGGGGSAEDKIREESLRLQQDLWKAYNDGALSLKNYLEMEQRVRDEEERRIRGLREEAKWLEIVTTASLRERELRALGRTDEAEELALFNRQMEEFHNAMKAGWSDEMLAYLAKVQELERQQLSASQTARKAEEAARKAEEAERALAAAREKAAAQAAAMEDLEVELLRAKGLTSEADEKAFALEQQRRLEDAQKNQTAEYVAKLKELLALQAANRAAAANAPVEAPLANTASSVFAGADTVTTSFGARVSAEVGDRMLANLVSIRVILRSIEGNTRNLGTRINNSLGLALADNYALNGSAVVS